MYDLLDSKTGEKLFNVPAGDAERLAKSDPSRYWFGKDKPVVIKGPGGELQEIDPKDAGKFLSETRGWYIEGEDEQYARHAEEMFGDRGLEAFLVGGGEGLTLGLSTLALTSSGYWDPEAVAMLKRANSGAAFAGELTGALAPIVMTGGAGALARGAGMGARGLSAAQTLQAATKIGARRGVLKGAASLAPTTLVHDAALLLERGIAKRLGGEAAETFGRKVFNAAVAKAGAEALEGGVYGTAEMVEEAALGGGPLRPELILAGAGLGAITGGLFEGGGQFLAKKAVQAKRLAKKAGYGTVQESLETMAEANRYRGAGLGGAEQKVVAKKGQDVSAGFGRFLRDEKISDTATATAARQRAQGAFSNALNQADEFGFSGISGEDVASIFQKGGRVLKDDIDALEVVDRYVSDMGELGDNVPFQLLTQVRVNLDDIGAPKVQEAIGKKLDDLMESKAKSLMAKGGPIGKQAAKDLEVLRRTQKKAEVAEQVFQSREGKTRSIFDPRDMGAAAIAWLVGGGSLDKILDGALTAAGGIVARRATAKPMAKIRAAFYDWMAGLKVVREMSDSVEQRVQGSLDNVLSGRRSRVPDVTTLKVLQEADFLMERERPERTSDLHAEFKRVSDELQAFQQAPDQLIERLTQRVASLAAVAPMAAAGTVQVATRAAMYLAEIMPKNPYAATSMNAFVGAYKHPKTVLASFARSVDAVKNPVGVFESLEAGRVPREGIEVLKNVYPELFLMAQNIYLDRLGEVQAIMLYDVRREMSLLLDLPLELTMAENVKMVAQSAHQMADQEGPQPSGGIPGASRLTHAERMQSASEKLAT